MKRLPNLVSLPSPIPILAADLRAAGGRAVLVGGSVRDALLGLESKDFDLEVFGLPAEAVEKCLQRRAKLDLVGRAFGVYKVKGLPLDVSLPRRESKQGQGHRGFHIEGDPTLDFATASARRDFTINAIGWDPLTGEIIDPHHGCEDLEKRILRHTSAQFSEDPLRVLRAMQFIARFDLQIAPETLSLCQTIDPENLPKERLFEEWKKLILKGKVPSRGLRFLQAAGWLKYYPELEAMVGCPQDPIWHPEGDVWEHTLHCMDAFARQRTNQEWEDLVVGFAVLLHDVGKPLTTHMGEDGRIRSPRHDVVGVEPARSFIQRLTAQKNLVDEVLVLVETHMRPAELYRTQAGSAAIRRLANKVGRIDRLVRLAEADMAGRPPLPADFPAGQWLLEQAEQLRLQDKRPKPILLGRHLIAEGLHPGPLFSEILRTCFEAQLDGEFEDEAGALSFLKKFLSERKNSRKKMD